MVSVLVRAGTHYSSSMHNCGGGEGDMAKLEDMVTSSAVNPCHVL
jgi:hypothetical protein